MSEGILLNGTFLSQAELLNTDLSTATFSAFEKEVILFFREWVSGKNAFEVQSSGSTGKPKNLTFSRENLMISARQTLKTFGLLPRQSALMCLSPSFIAGKMMIVRALVGKLNLVAVEPSENPLLQTDAAICFAAFTPQQLVAILENELSCKKVKEISTIIVGGGGVNPKTEEELKSFPNNIYHTFGMTETLTHVAIRKLSGKDQQQYYSCLEGVKIKLDDRECLMIQSPVNPEWIATNDIAEIIDDKHFAWLGRLDNVVNSGGIKIFPEEIEDKIRMYFAQTGLKVDFFTAGIPDKKFGQKFVLLIEGDAAIKKDKVLKDLKEILPRYKSPKDVFLCHRFVYTSSGKLKRKETLNLILQNDQ